MKTDQTNPDDGAAVSVEPDTDDRPEAEIALEEALGYRFVDRGLLHKALSHRSYAFEAGGLADNERLEFLGDAVLGVIVTHEIFTRLPNSAEGRLAKVRSAAVNTLSLADLARGIGIGEAVRLGVGEEQSGGRDKDSILANTMEAVIGAVYLDSGIEAATTVVLDLTRDLLDDIIDRRESLDFKTSLQELTAGELSTLPSYELSDVGPDHAKTFTAVVRVAGEELGRGEGRSKKEAEQNAAAEAYSLLRTRFTNRQKDSQ
nr:ribonuclease III [Euzebya rosea]